MNALTFWDLLACAPPERVALWAPEPLRYAALRERSEDLAGALVAAGVRAGDRVGVHLPPSVDEVAALFAVARLGAVMVPLPAQLPLAQVLSPLQDCGAVATLCAGPRAAELPGAIDVAGPLSPGVLPPPPEDPEALAAVLYTSGSTGAPKGVMHAHRSLLCCARGVSQYLSLSAEDRLLGLLPLSFHYGMSQVTSAFTVGASVVLAPSSFPSEVFRCMAEVSVAAGVPLSWGQLVRVIEQTGPPPRLRLITIAGGGASAALLDRLDRALPGVQIVLMYGFTEALRATYLPPERYADKRGAMGLPVPDARLEVVREDGSPCEADELGELVQRGALLGLGYWNQPAATAERWRSRGGEPACYSGDLVRQDRDGFFWFAGRKDGVIKTGGYRVGPGEIEDLVLASGLVGEVVAFGVPDPDRGQAVELAIEAGDPEALMAWCRRKLPHWMAPRRIHRLELPRRPNGKLDRAELLRRCIGGS